MFIRPLGGDQGVVTALVLMQSQGLQRKAAEQQHTGRGEGQGQHQMLRVGAEAFPAEAEHMPAGN